MKGDENPAQQWDTYNKKKIASKATHNERQAPMFDLVKCNSAQHNWCDWHSLQQKRHVTPNEDSGRIEANTNMVLVTRVCQGSDLNWRGLWYQSNVSP